MISELKAICLAWQIDNEKNKTATFSNQIGVRFYCIRNKQGDYWSNDFGWMELVDEAEEFPISIFTEEEKNKFNLPIDGFWEIF